MVRTYKGIGKLLKGHLHSIKMIMILQALLDVSCQFCDIFKAQIQSRPLDCMSFSLCSPCVLIPQGAAELMNVIAIEEMKG